MFLDTSFCIDLMREARRDPGPATAFLQGLGSIPLFASVFVLCELQAGARMSQLPDREFERVQRFTQNLNVIYPDEMFPIVYGELEVDLRKKGPPIPTMDLLIGTTAKMRGVPLITRDLAHFKLIPGLLLESY